MLIIVSWTDINMFQLDKIIFIHFRKDLSSSFHFWNRKNLKKIKEIWKFSVFFGQNFFCFLYFNLWQKTKKMATLTFFKNAYIFSDSRLKNHKIFIFHLLSNFMEILWKFSANHVQNFQLWFFEFTIKNQVKSLI